MDEWMEFALPMQNDNTQQNQPNWPERISQFRRRAEQSSQTGLLLLLLLLVAASRNLWWMCLLLLSWLSQVLHRTFFSPDMEEHILECILIIQSSRQIKLYIFLVPIFLAITVRLFILSPRYRRNNFQVMLLGFIITMPLLWVYCDFRYFKYTSLKGFYFVVTSNKREGKR